MQSRTARARRALRGLATGAIAALALAIGPAAAQAGTYDVTACDADPASRNNSWVPFSTDPAQMTAYNACPTAGNPHAGMVARNVVTAGGTAPFAARSGAQFTAPPGTHLERMWVAYKYGRADQNYHVAFLTDRSLVGPLCRANDGVWCDLIGTDINPTSPQEIFLGGSSQVRFETQCASFAGCATSSIGGWPYWRASLRVFSAKVRVHDWQSPSVGFDGGWLAVGSGWQRGSQDLVFSAEDNAGLKATRLLVDGHAVQSAGHDCDWSRPKPCGSVRGHRFTLNTATVSDGLHSVGIEAVDAAGNTQRVTRNVHVDNHAPGRPGLANMTGEDWKRTNSFDLRVTNPIGEVAPITKAHLTLCKAAPAGGCRTVTRDLANRGSGQANTLAAVAVADGVGEYTAKVHLEDEAGNVSAANASDPVRLRFDDVAPGRARPAQADGWIDARGAAAFDQAIALDAGAFTPVSGIAGYSVTTDGSEPDDTIEARVTDASGDAAVFTVPQALPEGVTTVKTRAVSGAGVGSAEVGQSAIRVDLTAPAASIHGAPPAGEWQRGAVTLKAIGADQPGLSGMGHLSYRLGGGEEKRVAGDEATISAADDGRHTLSYKATDAAGNSSPERQVELSIDRTAPETVVFEAQDPNDPLRLSVAVADRTSGVHSGVIEMRERGLGEFRALETTLDGGRLRAAIDDTNLANGTYEFRARVRDVAGNEAVSDRSAEGTRFTLEAPFRIATVVEAVAGKRALPRLVRLPRLSRRCGLSSRCVARYRKQHRRALARRRAQARQRIQGASVTVPHGRAMPVEGRLTSSAGRPVAGRRLEVHARLKMAGAPSERVTSVTTDGAGRFRYLAPKGAGRTLRFSFAGTRILQPSHADVSMAVRAGSTIRASRRRVTNGSSVVFSGRIGGPVPRDGKLVDLQAFYRGKWRTFAMPRANARGHWRFRYRFEATRGTVLYRFRVALRREAAYPYELGYSRAANVVVTGR